MKKRAVVSAMVLWVMLLFPGRVRADRMDDLIEPDGTFACSGQESHFIKSLPKLRVMVDEDFLPLSTYDAKTKSFRGVSIDLFKYIARTIGLQYEMLHVDGLTWSEKVKLFNAEKIDVLFPTSRTREREAHGLFTDGYYTSYYCAIARMVKNINIKDSSDLANYTIGVTKSTSIISFIEKFIPAEHIVYYNNQHELYQGIRKGQVDIGLRNNLVFHEERFNFELFDLESVYTIKESPRHYAYYFIKTDANARLVEIVNRCLASIDYSRLVAFYEKGADELVIRYVSQKQKQRQLWLILVIIAVILAFAVMYLFYYRKLTNTLAKANRQLELMNLTDPLTGLSNRRHFDAVLPKEYARHSRSGTWLSLIMLDIDYFKRFNDTYGHIQGDLCLKHVADVIRQCVTRASDLSVCYGGEEFICILPDTDLSGAMRIAEKIRQDIIALDIPHKTSDAAMCVTASLGVVSTKCRAGQAVLPLVAKVDAMLFAAKSRGRNRVVSLEVSGDADDASAVPPGP